jgi:hypothetical protein
VIIQCSLGMNNIYLDLLYTVKPCLKRTSLEPTFMFRIDRCSVSASDIKNDFLHWVRVRFMVFYATFNNISVISWRSVLLVEETGENHRPAASHCHALSHNVVSSTSRLSGVRTHNVSGDRH